MATFTWNGLGLDLFGLSGDWSPAGIPSLADTAVFASGGGSVAGVGNVSTLEFSVPAAWAWQAVLQAGNIVVNSTVNLSSGGSFTLTGSPAAGQVLAIGAGSGQPSSVTVGSGSAITFNQSASPTAFALLIGGTPLAAGTGTLTVTGAGTVNTGANGAAVGLNGSGTLTVQAGGAATFASPNSALIAALDAALAAGSSATITITGAGSNLTANGLVSLGNAGQVALTVSDDGTLTGGTGSAIRIGDGSATTGTGAAASGGMATATVTSGGTLQSMGALDVGMDGSDGTLTVSGAGSMVSVAGQTMLGTAAGGTQSSTGTIDLTNGATLQSSGMTIDTGSTVSVDGSSTLTTPTIAIDGGTADINALTTATSVTFDGTGTLGVNTITGANTVAGFTYGDTIDVGAGTGVSTAGNTITTPTGTLTLGDTLPSGSSLQTGSDGNGGTTVTLTPIPVYRFFDTIYGTHLFTQDQSEAATILATRPDLHEETNGFGAVTQGSPDSEAVYRFFESTNGTHFYTASYSEYVGLTTPGTSTYRPDLIPELNSTMYEDSVQLSGDVPVDRFFSTVNGSQFLTGDANEIHNITTPGLPTYRADLVNEGVDFYAPSGSFYTTA